MTETKHNTAGFASKLGIVLATAGSAVGLGNIWRFPTTTGENGGAAFILIYIAFTLFLGLPGMVAEFIVGRNGAANSRTSYAKAGRHSAWGMLGVIGMVCSMIILGFYSVVAGWCIYYLYMALTDQVLGDSQYVQQTFQTMNDSWWIPGLMGLVFVFLTHCIVVRGVEKGIEKASKMLMPMFFILLLVLIIASCSLPGAWAGIEFVFKPDFSRVTSTTFFEALGQSFFSLSLGTACLCTYASYFRKDTNLFTAAAQICGIDTGVAVMAGLMVFPAVFAVGMQPDAGPGLVFLTLPNVFAKAFPHAIAYVVSVLFYALLALAALTSTISMHEIGTSLMHQELNVTRHTSAWMETAVCCVISILCALSLGPVPELSFMGEPFFSNMDSLTSNILMPFSAFCTCLLVGWHMKRETVIEQLTSEGRYHWAVWVFNLYFFLVRFVCPIFILLIFLDKIGIF